MTTETIEFFHRLFGYKKRYILLPNNQEKILIILHISHFICSKFLHWQRTSCLHDLVPLNTWNLVLKAKKNQKIICFVWFLSGLESQPSSYISWFFSIYLIFMFLHNDFVESFNPLYLSSLHRSKIWLKTFILSKIWK